MMISVWGMEQFFRDLPEGYHYEFGTMSGTSIQATLDIVKNFKNPFLGIYAFDSFVGLPKEAPFVWHNPDWPEGAFDSVKYWEVNNVAEVIDKLKDKFKDYDTPIEYIAKWYCDLDENDAKIPKGKANYIHVDVDIYQSCVDCMDWLFKNNLVMDKAIFRFDDWDSTPLYTAGESRALAEISQKYNLKWQQLQDNIWRYCE